MKIENVFKEKLIKDSLLPLTTMIDIIVRDYLVNWKEYEYEKLNNPEYAYSKEASKLQDKIAYKLFVRLESVSKHKKYGRICRLKDNTSEYIFPLYNKGFIRYKKFRDTRSMSLYLVNGYAMYCTETITGGLYFSKSKYKRVIGVDTLEINMRNELLRLEKIKKLYETDAKGTVTKGKGKEDKIFFKDVAKTNITDEEEIAPMIEDEWEKDDRRHSENLSDLFGEDIYNDGEVNYRLKEERIIEGLEDIDDFDSENFEELDEELVLDFDLHDILDFDTEDDEDEMDTDDLIEESEDEDLSDEDLENFFNYMDETLVEVIDKKEPVELDSTNHINMYDD